MQEKKQYVDNDLAWEEITREHIVEDEWIDFRRSSYKFPDGEIREPFYSYSRRDYVVIVAKDQENRYICVTQFRHGIRKVTVEFPAGGIERKDGKEYGEDKGDAASEKSLVAAKRELLEETGYVSDEWEHMITVPSNATLADNYAHIFTASNCRRAGEQDLDEMEFLNVMTCSGEDIRKMIKGGQFSQAMHIMAWLMSREKEA